MKYDMMLKDKTWDRCTL